MSDNATIVLVDGSGYLFRAYHALPPLNNSRGEATGAIYGVVNMLRRLWVDYPDSPVIVVFDAPGGSFRDQLFAEYKAHRPPMPEDLREQIGPMKALVAALGFPLIEVPRVEADDVIGTLAAHFLDAGREVIISTGDKDMAQLVVDGVTLVNTMTGTVLDREGVKAKFGVPPERIVDYLALVGDTADNIPGVPKVGPKTAAKWLNEYGSLDAIIEQADGIKGKVGENLREHLDQLRLSRELATIKCDLALDLANGELEPRPADTERLRELFTDLEFRSWLRQLDEDDKAIPDTAADHNGSGPDYHCITDPAELDAWIGKLQAAEAFAFDTETTSLEAMRARIVGVSFAVAPGSAAYVPLAHDYPGAPDQLDRDQVLARLKPLLEAQQPGKIGHNLKYDRNVLANHGIDLQGIVADTMLESYVVNSVAGRHDMDSLAARTLGHTTIKYEDVAGKGAKQLSFNQVPLETAAPYAAEDAEVTLRLHQALAPRLDAEPGLRRVYREIELPLLPVLARIERTGVLVDAALLGEISRELAERMAETEARAHDVAGQPFNLGSPKQIQEILYDRLQLPVLAKTPKGQPSTAESVLAELAQQHELPQLILEHRGLSKLRSTYTERLPVQINPDTGRIHTSYHQAVAATGRLSSSDPNLQNIPVRSPEGRRIRQAFIAPEGKRILAADYSQIELRIMAHLSADQGLLNAFAAGEDIHRATAAEVFGTERDAVTAEQRRAAKAINFGLIYGMSAFGLARQLGIERGAAQTYVERYFARYPGVAGYMERTREQAREQGYVETLFGRRLYLPEINDRNAARRAAAERTAINAPMQGTAADIIKRAMLAVQGWIDTGDLDLTIIMQVHDELVFEVAEDALTAACHGIRQHMQGAAELRVPLLVEIGEGVNWDQAH